LIKNIIDFWRDGKVVIVEEVDEEIEELLLDDEAEEAAEEIVVKIIIEVVDEIKLESDEIIEDVEGIESECDEIIEEVVVVIEEDEEIESESEEEEVKSLDDLPTVIANIILDYKTQLEHCSLLDNITNNLAYMCKDEMIVLCDYYNIKRKTKFNKPALESIIIERMMTIPIDERVFCVDLRLSLQHRDKKLLNGIRKYYNIKSAQKILIGELAHMLEEYLEKIPPTSRYFTPYDWEVHALDVRPVVSSEPLSTAFKHKISTILSSDDEMVVFEKMFIKIGILNKNRIIELVNTMLSYNMYDVCNADTLIWMSRFRQCDFRMCDETSSWLLGNGSDEAWARLFQPFVECDTKQKRKDFLVIFKKFY